MAKSDPVLRKDPFDPGFLVKPAGVFILQRLPDLPRKSREPKYRAWHYLVQCLRCGHERHMYHASIMHRATEKISGCRACAHLDLEEKDDEVLSFDYDKWVDPPWKVPSHVR